MLAGTACFLSARHGHEIVLPRERFASFPRSLGSWVGNDIDMAPDVLRTLGPGDFLARKYRNTSTDGAPVDLFVAYFPSQRAGDTLHSPKHCLPGSGWTAIESNTIKIQMPGRDPFLVNRYVIAKGSRRGLALYWYWAHGRAVASEYWAKFYLVEDSIRFNRSDGALIRVTTELRPPESPEDAQPRLLWLVRKVLPPLDAYVPR